MGVLDDDAIRGSLLTAWQDSYPSTATAHEEGGFILRSSDGTLMIERWPRGAQNEIIVPPHPGGMCNNKVIVATFHTHPNPPPDFQQEPSLTDIRAVRDDPDLSHTEYQGEYVIATESIYRILRSGEVIVIGSTKELLGTN